MTVSPLLRMIELDGVRTIIEREKRMTTWESAEVALSVAEGMADMYLDLITQVSFMVAKNGDTETLLFIHSEMKKITDFAESKKEENDAIQAQANEK